MRGIHLGGRFSILGGLFAAVLLCAAGRLWAEDQPTVVATAQLAAGCDRQTGQLVSLKNLGTGENYALGGDQFDVEARPASIRQADAKPTSLELRADGWTATYVRPAGTVETRYTLRGHFLEKQVSVTFGRPVELLRIVVSRPKFSGTALEWSDYGYPKFGRKAGAEPCRTFFGRTEKGGIFTGLEMPFGDCAVSGQEVQLAFAPHMKLPAGEKFDCPAIYFGVYGRTAGEAPPAGGPLRSEADAMVAMTSAILGPPRHGLVPMVCGWHSQMHHTTYTTPAEVEAAKHSIDFSAECGIDYLCEGHPWCGQTDEINSLVDDQHFTVDALQRQFIDHAAQAKIKIVTWLTMNNSHPWWAGHNKPLRPDKPEWLLAPDREHFRGVQYLDPPPLGNCVANKPFLDWLLRANRELMQCDKSQAWVVDGDFFGGPGWYTTVVPVRCLADNHDHLPGDSNFCCQRALERLVADVRNFNPQMYILTCRPAQDLGVWAQRNFDGCFTLLEEGAVVSNLAAADKIRTWSRTRLEHEFLPHYLDQPLLFPSLDTNPKAQWSSEHIDYIMLSALASSPNQLYYLPTTTGIPAADKSKIREWLDWGRANIKYLLVRQDFADWPAASKLDGSAHIVDDAGLVCWFNSGEQPLEAQFSLSAESIGLTCGERYRVRQHYPAAERAVLAGRGEAVRWQVPPQSALVLEVRPAE